MLSTCTHDTIWIKGHQDSNKPVEELSPQARLNIHADHLASIAQQQIAHRKLKKVEYKFPFGRIWITSNNREHSSQEVYLTRWKYSELVLQKYYADDLFKVKFLDLHDINWAGLRIARSRLSSSEQSFSIKQMIGWLPTGHKTKQYGQLINTCPYCHHQKEDVDHLWLCPSRLEQNKAIIFEFQHYLETEKTHPDIITAMISGLLRHYDETKENRLEFLQ
jgi:hypothetical protein